MNKLPIIQKGDSSGIYFGTKNRIKTNVLLIGYAVIIFFFFSFLLLRLFHLAVVKGGYYSRLAEENRMRELILEAKRGSILDRKGFMLVQNSLPDIKKNDERLSSSRRYENPEATAHIVGYRQKADQKDIKEDKCLNKLKLGDKTGKKGIEKLFECELRGKHGKKLIEVDASGSYVRTLGISPSSDGQNIQLALDFELQKKAFETMKDKKGAIVVLKPTTGEILALVSTPTFNSQYFEDEKTDETATYFADQEKPLFNRATEAGYPPGSIFKLTIASAALEEKSINEKTVFEDTGIIKAGPLTFGNWYFLQYGKTEGSVDVIKALRRSNDIFFYKTGELLGVDKIKKWARTFGFGETTHVGFEESEGLIPSAFWKEETLKDNWYLGDTYNLSIGQGYVLSTPLQIAVASTAFANGGYICKPELLKTQDSTPNIKQCKKLPISSKTLQLVREGMKQACSPGGTGWPLFDFAVNSVAAKSGMTKPSYEIATGSVNPSNDKKIQTACKTGTAESHAESGNPHAWFTVFAPFDKPEIAVTVLVEEGGQGADIAAPIAKDLLTAFFQRNQ